MNILDERDVRTVHRKLQKRKYDEILKLSVQGGEEVRLLDEGTVVDINGSPLFYLTKGTLKRYLDALPDDYEGHINLGHMDFSTFPFLLGRWTKEDMRLQDIGDGRQCLMVSLHLDEENVFVRELRRAGYTLCVSAEFGYHENTELTQKLGLQIIDEIFITAFAIVGEAGNVNSSGIQLGGKSMTLQELNLSLDKETDVTIEDLNKKLDAVMASAEEEKKPEADEAEKAKAEEGATPEEEKKPEAEEEEKPEEKGTEPEENAEGEDALAEVTAKVEALVEENEGLKAKVEELTARLSAKDKAEKEFVEKFKKLSASVGKKTERVAEVEIEEDVYTDGLGE